LIWIVGATALAAGLLVGLTGIGGVLLVPVLTGAAGQPLDRLPDTGVRLFVAALAFGSGAHALLSRQATAGRIPGAAWLAVLGFFVGYGSAISGTGGPVMLIPLLLALRTPVTAAIALGVTAGMPITAAATAVYVAEGLIDLPLALTLAALLIAGTWAGARLSARLSGRALTAAVAWTLVGVGIWFGYASLH
jgi:hypothetical protein